MRRSAAPSQLGCAAKRPRFNSPYLSLSHANQPERTTADVLKLINGPQAARHIEKSEVVNINVAHSQAAIKQLTSPDEDVSSAVPESDLCELPNTSQSSKENLSGPASNTDDPGHHDTAQNIEKPTQQPQKLVPKFRSFKTPAIPKSAHNSGSRVFSCPMKISSGAETNSLPLDHQDADSEPKCHYFNVMWCKLSKKKHKKWEGDAILVTKGRTVSLLDTDGKESRIITFMYYLWIRIGRGSGYKTKELETLAEGHTLSVGGKEIEVMSILSEATYKSGQCFTGSVPAASQPASLQTLNTGVSRPFNKPQKDGQNITSLQVPAAPAVVKPRYDVDAPDALVLPRPPQSHQWEHNKNKLCVVDMVVDPYLSQHLRPHQRAGVVFLYECIMGIKNYNGHGAILADEMGLGKTLQCIALIWTLLKQGPYGGKPVVRRVLVITPGSLVKNWLREFKKWLGTERLRVFAVSQDNKIQDFVDSTMYPVLIISYEMFMRCVDTIQTINFDLIICDEGHRLKNTTIKTTTLVSSMASRRRVVLTGTPVQNDLQELYSIVDFCNPGILGTAAAFRHVYEEPILASRRPAADTEDRALGETRAAELNRITALFILRRTSDINNKYLPPKVDMVMFCKASPLQLNLYKKLLTSRVVHSCLYSRDMAQHLMCISALRKLCNHPGLLYDQVQAVATRGQQDNMQQNSERELYEGLYDVYPEGYDSQCVGGEQSGKLNVLAQMLDSFYTTTPQQRVVLVSNYTQTLDILENHCKVCGYQSLRLDGQTPTSKRQQLVERFNSQYSTDFVFLLSSKAGGVGLNLIGASRLILYDIDWNPANDLQAMARVWRDGQRRTVYIYRLLITGSIEEKIYQRQITKQGLSSVVVDAKASSTNQVQFSQEDLRDLFTMVETSPCVTHDMLDCECNGKQQREQTQLGEQPSRTCQISQTSKKHKKNLCMDELFQWQHISGPSPSLDVDPVLSEVDLQNVSFVFYCQSNISKVTQSDNQ